MPGQEDLLPSTRPHILPRKPDLKLYLGIIEMRQTTGLVLPLTPTSRALHSLLWDIQVHCWDKDDHLSPHPSEGTSTDHKDILQVRERCRAMLLAFLKPCRLHSLREKPRFT